MEESLLFLLLSYALTQLSPGGRGRLPTKSSLTSERQSKRVLTKKTDWFIIRDNSRIGIQIILQPRREKIDHLLRRIFLSQRHRYSIVFLVVLHLITTPAAPDDLPANAQFKRTSFRASITSEGDDFGSTRQFDQ